MCRPGTIVVTTDRALDSKWGWRLMEQMDMNNPEVLESTGFIQQRVEGYDSEGMN